MNKTKDMADWARKQLEDMARDPAIAEALSKEELHAAIAQQIYDFREQAHLTQKELAKKSGTTQSVISRIEDDDYEGHSLALLHKIAWALNLKLMVKFYKEIQLTTIVPLNATNTVSSFSYPGPGRPFAYGESVWTQPQTIPQYELA